MLVIVTNSADATADYVERCINSHDISYARIDSDTLTSKAIVEFDKTSATIVLSGQRVDAADVTCIWHRRPKPITVGAANTAEDRHTALEWAEAIEGVLCHVPFNRWINHPSAVVGASRKIEQISRAISVGLNVPETLVTQDPTRAANFIKKSPHGAVTKPLSSGFIERDDGSHSLIYTNGIDEGHFAHLDLVRHCPTLIQFRIPKISDVRVVYIDGHVRAVEMKRMQGGGQILDIRRDNMRGVDYTQIQPPGPTERMIVRIMNSYSLRFGALDFVVDAAGEWWFLEVNPNGQWAWLDICAGTDICADMLDAFCRGVGNDG